MAIRSSEDGEFRRSRAPLMVQRWSDLLFLHWRADVAGLRHHIPGTLEIETFDGSAWVGVTPFAIPEMRPAHLPSLPILGTSLEVNVRTYVRSGMRRGVWFFSLDANNLLAVAGARVGFHLPYFPARMRMTRSGARLRFTSRRAVGATRPELEAEWERGLFRLDPRPATRSTAHARPPGRNRRVPRKT